VAGCSSGEFTQTIFGRVVQVGGGALPEVDVYLLGRRLLTNERGGFRYDDPPEGPVTIRATADFFTEDTRTVDVPEDGSDVEVRLHLTPQLPAVILARELSSGLGIWIGVRGEEALAALRDYFEKATVGWIGGLIRYDVDYRHGFYFEPGTVAAMAQAPTAQRATIENIISDPVRYEDQVFYIQAQLIYLAEQ
jgi:hypothetical protein